MCFEVKSYSPTVSLDSVFDKNSLSLGNPASGLAWHRIEIVAVMDFKGTPGPVYGICGFAAITSGAKAAKASTPSASATGSNS